jgi:hypothetical protein
VSGKPLFGGELQHKLSKKELALVAVVGLETT